ncbi:hypothetical protein AQ436_03110 [Arthrobacter sp. EpRS66]|nr:hypothetical protein AQ436_03110 [Arthrobacter sp. EpRS66]
MEVNLKVPENAPTASVPKAKPSHKDPAKKSPPATKATAGKTIESVPPARPAVQEAKPVKKKLAHAATAAPSKKPMVKAAASSSKAPSAKPKASVAKPKAPMAKAKVPVVKAAPAPIPSKKLVAAVPTVKQAASKNPPKPASAEPRSAAVATNRAASAP